MVFRDWQATAYWKAATIEGSVLHSMRLVLEMHARRALPLGIRLPDVIQDLARVYDRKLQERYDRKRVN
jgi:hypothetical protein